MYKIRLKRMGAKKQPFYRIVATDSRNKRDGKYDELVGTYSPLDGTVKINEELVLDLLKKGAQPTETVRSILSKNGTLTKFHNEKVSK